MENHEKKKEALFQEFQSELKNKRAEKN